MISKQQSLTLSPYLALYDILIPEDNELRQLNDLVDFSFVLSELEANYCHDNGRNAIDPIRMFKYLLLKTMYDVSDVDLVKRSKTDLAFKYFLGMAPEDDVIDPSSLTKFRKLRLKDIELLDLLINKSVEIAIEKKIIKSKTIIVDATHTSSRYNQKSPCEILRHRSKNLRKSVYNIDEGIKGLFPEKNTFEDLEKEIEYSQNLVDVIENNEFLVNHPNVIEKLNHLKETIEDDIEYLNFSNDEDARIGHKSADTSFFGYKTHIAMTEERIITSAIVTSGEKSDGKQLQELIEKSVEAGIDVDTVVGDGAYSGKDNIEYTDNKEISLVAKLHPMIANGTRKDEAKFDFNKDAGMFVCPAGHMAIRKARTGKKDQSKNQVTTYYFDVEKCKRCPLNEGCYKGGAKSKSYSVSILSETHKKQEEFQKSDYFKDKSKHRYKIEAKNAELKNRHGYNVANSSGQIGMELQGAMAIFVVNLKRIQKLMNQ